VIFLTLIKYFFFHNDYINRNIVWKVLIGQCLQIIQQMTFSVEQSRNMTALELELQNQRVHEAFRKERERLLNFIKQRVPRQEDAEDIVQEVFFELMMMNRLMKPVEHLASWLFTVARNKITDLYRKKKPLALEDMLKIGTEGDEENQYLLADILPSSYNSAYDNIMSDAIMGTLADALAELPNEQRNVFVWHELEDKSFKEIAELTGAPLNTLLSRKRYAVLFLREKLQHLYNDLAN
jgi:RNA polymerase sigma factor (sigma-70 family)